MNIELVDVTVIKGPFCTKLVELLESKFNILDVILNVG